MRAMGDNERRLVGTIKIFNLNKKNAHKLFIFSYRRHEDDRKLVTIALNNLMSGGRVTKTRFTNLVKELEEKRISLNARGILTTKKDIINLRDKKIREYDEAGQFALDQSIVSTAINFEEFIRRTFIKFYTDDPRRLSKEKELTLGDIVNKTDLLSVYEEVAEKATKDLLYGSASKWFTALEKSMKVDFSGHERDVETVKELFLVRNCIVHNAKYISRELLSHHTKYIGITKVNPTYKDYVRFKKASTQIVYVVFNQYNEKYSKRYLSVRSVTDDIKNLHEESTGTIRGGISLDLNRERLNTLIKKYERIDLVEIRQLLQSEILESKLLATKLLTYQYSKSKLAQDKQKIFLFCILNLGLFNDRELIHFITRSIITGHKLAGHNIQIIRSLSYFSDPLKAYFLLKLIEKSPALTSRRHLLWIINNIDRHAIKFASSKDDRDRLQRAKRKALLAIDTIPE